MSLLTDEDKTKNGKDSVTLMTLHNSKGSGISYCFHYRAGAGFISLFSKFGGQ